MWKFVSMERFLPRGEPQPWPSWNYACNSLAGRAPRLQTIEVDTQSWMFSVCSTWQTQKSWSRDVTLGLNRTRVEAVDLFPALTQLCGLALCIDSWVDSLEKWKRNYDNITLNLSQLGNFDHISLSHLGQLQAGAGEWVDTGGGTDKANVQTVGNHPIPGKVAWQ